MDRYTLLRGTIPRSGMLLFLLTSMSGSTLKTLLRLQELSIFTAYCMGKTLVVTFIFQSLNLQRNTVTISFHLCGRIDERSNPAMVKV